MCEQQPSGSSSSSSAKETNLFLIGDVDMCKNLFNKIDLYYKNSKNSKLIDRLTITNDELNRYNMHITTKYYETDVKICVFNDSNEDDFNELSKKMNELSVNGLVIYENNDEQIEKLYLNKTIGDLFDRIKNKCLKLYLIDDINDSCKDDLDAFCDKYDLNLIELNRKYDDEDVEEESSQVGSGETGLDDLISALLVHEWPFTITKPTHSSQTISKKSETIEKKPTVNEDNFENFEDLMLNIQQMRENASKMDDQSRKKYAEDFVKKLWHTIGGEEEELASLDDDDDED